MNTQLLSIATLIFIGWTWSHAEPAVATPPERGANRFMHQSDFQELAARFEDPARAQWQKPTQVIASLGSLDGKTVADIGAGSGYFAVPVGKKAAKVIAIDIDQRFLDYIEQKKQREKIGANIETRLASPDSPRLKPGEADMVLIVDTFHHIENRIDYLRNLKKALRKGGVLVIIDFKKEAPPPPGPPVELRLAQKQVESELRSAGFAAVSMNRDMLPYQYVIKAQ